jgi:hypothetical protein
MNKGLVAYPGVSDQTQLTEEEISLKIARHSFCSLCECDGLRPIPELKVIVKTANTINETEDVQLLDTCLCTHRVIDHGNPVNESAASERNRRAKVAFRLDELLQVSAIHFLQSQKRIDSFMSRVSINS